MRPLLLLSIALILASRSNCGTTVSNGEDLKQLLPFIELIELEYEDHCEKRASTTWDELIGTSGALEKKLDQDKVYGIFARQQTLDVRGVISSQSPLLEEDEVLKRKIKLILEPGDMLLETEQWIKLVTFGETALHEIRFATNYDCGTNENCTLKELHKSIANQPDEEILKRIKNSWNKNFPDVNEYKEHILPLLRNATKENQYKTVEEYWDSLCEYEGGLLKARELWDQIKPLYVKLQKYVTLRLKGPEAVGQPLPVHLLKSLSGNDWSNVIESLLPKHPDIYQKLHANLQLKISGGYGTFRVAEKLLEDLKLGPLDAQIWNESEFNGTCPTVLVDWCKPSKIRAFTCKDVSIGRYMDAHESVMKVKHKEIAAIHSNNTYILREANRYSAIYEAIPGFASLLSMTPHALDSSGLYPLERFNYRSNSNHHRLVLQLIVALRDLPRLNYYLAADEWRLKVLMGAITSSKVISSWREFRKDFSLLDSSENDLLGDPYVLLNKPLLGKYMGIILKYQIYQSYAEELISDDANLIQHVSENNHRLLDAMSRGYGVKWPEMVSDLLAKREYGLEYTGLTDYFKFLEEYLDNQLEQSTDNIQIEYEEPPEESANEIPANEIPAKKIENNNEITELASTHENIVENIIDSGNELRYKDLESSTVAVMEIKNPVVSKEEPIQEASSNVYWWIGVGVALAVVTIIIGVIAKKRQTHRKDLERQRRETSRA